MRKDDHPKKIVVAGRLRAWPKWGPPVAAGGMYEKFIQGFHVTKK